MSKQQTILKLLAAGNKIRRMDGRCGNQYVDKNALENLIRSGLVTVYEQADTDFVRAKVTK